VTLGAGGSDQRARLLAAIESREIRVGIIGLGYVGLPLARAFADAGYRVLGFDTDPAKVEKLAKGQSYIGHISDQSVASMTANGFEATDQFDRLGEPDAVIICVPTPLTEARDPDLGYVVASAQAIADRLRSGQLVVLESTTYPGTTRDVVLPILEAGGLRAGSDFFLAFSPEREDPGNPTFSAPTIPKVVGGLDPASLEVALALYGRVVVRVVPVSGPEVAEACKILENTYRAVNIALVNELKVLFDRMGIDVWEVIEAAKTKPFGFQAFYPGPGLGGHCLAGSETVRIRGQDLDTVLPLADLFERFRARFPLLQIGDAEVLEPSGLETLSIDSETGKVSWKAVSHLFRRQFRGTMVEIRLAGNRTIRATDRHPMLIVSDDRLVVREARDLKAGDRVPLFNGLSAGSEEDREDARIDLLATLPASLVDRLHVRHRDVPWVRNDVLLKKRYGWTIRDSIRNNSLSVNRFFELEAELGFERERLILLSGRGSAHTTFPAILRVRPEICRLIGYFLSEGCISDERGNPRVRFTFNRDELEYIEDVVRILAAIGVSTSRSNDKTYHTTTLRAGSIILGHLFRDVLHSGVNSLTMRIPAVVMGGDMRHREQVVAGLLRGDGDVNVQIGLRAYRKHGRDYTHQLNTGQAGYFSSSPELLAQVGFLLQGMGLQPTRKKSKPHLRIAGRENLLRLIPLFSGEKGDRLGRLEAARLRPGPARTAKAWSEGRSLAVVGVTPSPADEPVFSLEVPGTHTFATTGGVFVHNCIPIDPFYLSWVARKHGFTTRFIELAGEINTSMPTYVVQRLADALNDRGLAVKGSKVLLLGMAYKKDVDDPRESPGFELMELLLEKGAEVDYSDPHIPTLPSMRRYPHLKRQSQPLSGEYLASRDCVLIVTDHSSFDWPWIVEHSRLVVDTRNATRGISAPLGRIVRA
jgi:UDP-N-acetyl-D-mannosaminuronate dehydrogenase/intein/homing endonuclease